MMNKSLIKLLQCPISGGALTLSDDGHYLISKQAQCRFAIENDIALLLADCAEPLSRADETQSSSASPAAD